MKVYFVRHAESEANKANVHQSSDIKLSRVGIKQAKILAERMKKLDIDFIYSSDYARAKQTAEIIASGLDKPIEYWSNLREVRNPSEIMGLKHQDQLSLKIRERIRKNFHKGNWKYSDEENFNDLKNRGEKVLNHLLKKHKGQNVVCISHGTILTFFLALMIFVDELTPELYLKFRYHFWTENTGITICEYTDEYGWGILTFNDIAHL